MVWFVVVWSYSFICISKLVQDLDVEVIILSPMTRAIQTYVGAFGDRHIPVVVSLICREGDHRE